MTAPQPATPGSDSEVCGCGHGREQHREFPSRIVGTHLGCAVTAEDGSWADTCNDFHPAALDAR